MSCEEILSRVTELSVEAGGAPDGLPPEVEEHLAECPGCRAEAEELGALWRSLALLEAQPPEAELREGFDGMLAAYQAGLADGKAGGAGGTPRPGGRHRWLPSLLLKGWSGPALAYGLLALLVGLGLGVMMARGGGALGGLGDGELRALRGEVRALNELVTLSLLEAPSATERLQGVAFGSRMERPDREVLAALVEAATRDPNVNVRLAAIEALAPVASRPRVLGRLVEALPEQDSPLVQVTLVDLLLSSDGDTARRAAAALLEDEGVHPEVRRHIRERLARRI